jgi:hypothetical protein
MIPSVYRHHSFSELESLRFFGLDLASWLFFPLKMAKICVCVCVCVCFFVFVVARFQQFFLEKSPDFFTGVLACSQKYEGFLKLKNLSYLVYSQIWLNLLVDDC